MMEEREIIDRKLAAEALRRLADRIETSSIRVTVLDHQFYKYDSGHHTLSIKWEGK